MAYDWTAPPTDSVQPDKLPHGFTGKVSVSKVYTSNKEGKPYTTKKGDPMIMVIVRDDQDREATISITLTPAGAWVLRNLMQAAGMDMQALMEQGIEPAAFSNPAVAETLLDRSFHVKVEHQTSNGKTFAKAMPIQAEPEPEVDIPF